MVSPLSQQEQTRSDMFPQEVIDLIKWDKIKGKRKLAKIAIRIFSLLPLIPDLPLKYATIQLRVSLFHFLLALAVFSVLNRRLIGTGWKASSSIGQNRVLDLHAIDDPWRLECPHHVRDVHVQRPPAPASLDVARYLGHLGTVSSSRAWTRTARSPRSSRIGPSRYME